MEGNLVSVIVPIYNSEKYMRSAVDSILQQTYSDLEVILVDDGSTDNSGVICDKYAKIDSRIKVLHQKNSGQAAARNAAYKISMGKYIVYADSDDLMHREQIQYMVQVQQETDADIVHVENVKFQNAKKIKKILQTEMIGTEYVAYTAEGALEQLCYQKKFSFGPWCKLIKRELMENLEFPVNMGYEDAAIMYKLYGKASKLIYSSAILYCYRQHATSTMHNGFSEKKVDRIRIMGELKSYINQKYPRLGKAVQTRFCLAQLQLLMELPFSTKYRGLKKKVYQNIKNSRQDVLSDSKAPLKNSDNGIDQLFGP